MQINQVLNSFKTQQRLRIIFVDLESYQVIDIDDPYAWPTSSTHEELEGFEVIIDPFPLPSVQPDTPTAERRDEALNVIKPLLEQYDQLFEKSTRNKLIKLATEASNKPRLYVIRTLKRYWQRGMAPNALAPDYRNSGGKGKQRRTVKNKLGRKRTVSPGEGAIVTDEIAGIFRSAIELFYSENNRTSLSDAYTKALSMLKSRFPLWDATQMPSKGQFNYFYRANYKKHDILKRRTPAKIYDKDHSPLKSTATANNFGPGARYEIDATIADIYLVSEHDHERIVGRPTIYLVKDVFSRMVPGMYVGFENPSYVTAAIAMANAFGSKTDYCKQFGITITDESWPSIGTPASILADRGELLFRQADALVNRFHIDLSNTRAYRGDDKGIVERHFNTIQTEFKPYAEGIVESVNGKKRLGKRYELDAELSLSAFTEIMIRLVLRHNNEHVLTDYDFAADMPPELIANPLTLWNWGIKHRTGKLRACDKTLAYINLLPCKTATISQEGIRLNKLFYSCQEALSVGWFDRIKQNRPSEVDVCFDPRNTNTIYVRPSAEFEVYWVAELSDRSRRYRGMTFAEASQLQLITTKSTAAAKQHEQFSASDTQRAMQEIVERERKKKPKQSTKTASEKLRGIRDNRRDELENERERTIGVNKKVPIFTSENKVIDINTRAEKGDTLDYPDLDQFLDDDDD